MITEPIASAMTIRGSWGELSVDPLSGDVLAYHPNHDAEKDPPSGYGDIARFDVAEHELNGVDQTDYVDILDFGYWTHEGVYESPVEDWRQAVRAGDFG